MIIMQREENRELVLPKNIRQMGVFGDTYKVYVEDFVYTYVHQFIHRRKKEDWYWQLSCWEKRCVRENRNMCLSAAPRR